MRRNAVVITTLAATIAAVSFATPAYAAFHDRVKNPYLHSLLDVLTLAIVASPLWTAWLWGSYRRRGLIALIAVVQIPVAVFSFVPIADPILHAVALALSITITTTAICYVRRAAKYEQATRAAAAETETP
ncbi:MAG TPA: hypothetical protein VE172_01310 [Stackebrandtia sp.]|jgi:uncharacterized membrane protein|uniref:hypothetical protein n=1 Tax=Stackebrandtia sp. TaxID=2023065 RepID=UPI002D46FB67|nr:hypothetical protein [Stackebrandtia sp.]HZE37425.1 hypothetical protein [Stackebrandtia sp.]